MKKEYKLLILIGIFYLLYILLFIIKFEFNPSATIELSENSIFHHNGIIPSGLVVQKNSDGFDGQFYYFSAIDISYENSNVPLVWYQRIFYPFLSYLFALGNMELIQYSLLLLNYAAILLTCYFFYLLIKKENGNINLVYLFALNVGYFITLIRDTPSPWLILLIIVSVYSLKNRFYFVASLFFALAMITREVALTFILSVIFYFIFIRKPKIAGIVSLSLIPFLVWQFVLFVKYGQIAFLASFCQISWPFFGLLGYLLNIPFNVCLKDLIWYLTTLPFVLFAIIQSYLLIKDKSPLTLYKTLLLGQVISIFLLGTILLSHAIDTLGRFSIGMFMFSILFSAEKRQKYNILLLLIMIGLSLFYFFVKIIRFKVDYFIS